MYCLKLTYFLENILPVKYEFNLITFILIGIEKIINKMLNLLKLKQYHFNGFKTVFRIFFDSETFSW